MTEQHEQHAILSCY